MDSDRHKAVMTREDLDAARTHGLTEALERVLPALEALLRYEPVEDRARLRSTWRPALDLPLPARGVGADEVLRELDAIIAHHGLHLGAPGFCGWVSTVAPVIPVTAQLVSTLAAPQRWWTHPGNFLELHALDWLKQLLGFPETFGGTFTSGGAVANLLGLGAARQHAGERLGFDVAREGVAVLSSPRVYASDAVHHVVGRALGTLGLGREALRTVTCRKRTGVDLEALRRVLDEDIARGDTPVAVVATAGDVNTGAVEPLDAMRRIAKERGIWFHVDGCYGGFGVLDPRVEALYGDRSRYDSFTIDPHKWLAAPVGCGAVLVREVGYLERAFALDSASYVPGQRRTGEDPASSFDGLGEGSPHRGLEHSSPSRGLVVWALLREIGAEGVAARVARHLDCARRVAARVRACDELQLLAEPILSICCFRYRPDTRPHLGERALTELNRAVLAELQARGRAVPSSTRLHGTFAIRPCFIGPRATVADAERLVDEVLEVGRALSLTYVTDASGELASDLSLPREPGKKVKP